METLRIRNTSSLETGPILLSVGLFAVSMIVLAVFTNPIAVGLPVAGTATAAALMWSVDRIQAGITLCIPGTAHCFRTGTD